MPSPLTSVMNMFSSNPVAAATVDPAAPTALAPLSPPGTNIPAQPVVAGQVTPATAANGLVPEQPVVTEPQVPNSPIDEFSSLWETAPIDPNAPKSDAPTSLTLNPEDVAKAMGKADFSSAVTPENLTAITAGGEGAAEAFMQALNAVAQQSMTQAIMITNKLGEKNIEAALAKQALELPAQIRSQTNASHLKDANPLFSNPAIAPVAEQAKSQLELKYPNDTPAQITEKVQNYMVAMGEMFQPKAAADATPAGDTDWENFLGG